MYTEIKEELKEFLQTISERYDITINSLRDLENISDLEGIEADDMMADIYEYLECVMEENDLDEEDIEEIFEDIFWDDLEPMNRQMIDTAISHMDSVTVWSGNEKSLYAGEQLTGEAVQTFIDDTLSGKYMKLRMELKFQDEGKYIKQLDKTVHNTWNDTLLIYSADTEISLLYFCRKKPDCYKLICREKCNCSANDLKDISFGNVKLQECVVHSNRELVEKGLSFIFSDILNVSERLSNSAKWCPEIPAGQNSFHKLCVELGAVDES